MKKIILVILALVVVGVAYWLISPFFINKKVEEKLEDIMKVEQSPSQAVSPEVISQGTFTGLEGHRAEGSARLIKIVDKYFIRFEDDFRITNGPDLFVYFGKNDQYDASAKIAHLKGNIGGQNYEVPAGINPANFNEIWVWCRAFRVAFGKAVLK